MILYHAFRAIFHIPCIVLFLIHSLLILIGLNVMCDLSLPRYTGFLFTSDTSPSFSLILIPLPSIRLVRHRMVFCTYQARAHVY